MKMCASRLNLRPSCDEDGSGGPCILHWYMATTDAGPNEIGARKIVQSDLKDLDSVMFTETTCLEHSQHLVSLACLKAADAMLHDYRSWKYYASLATSSNVCRLMARKIFDLWATTYGFQSAKKDCKRLWPKACAGRWSGCDKPEKRFLSCTQERLVPVLSNILQGQTVTRNTTGGMNLDELQIEESKAYSEKMTRWKKKMFEVVNDDLWWRCLGIMNEVRQPLSHLSNYLQQRQGEWGHIAQLCTGKADSISQEFWEVWPRLQRHISGDDEDAEFARILAHLAFLLRQFLFVAE